MSFKSLFVKKDDETPVEEKKSSSKKVPAIETLSNLSTQNYTQNLPSALTSNPATGLSNEKSEFAEFLNDIYVKGNFPGPDYQEYTDALKAIESAPLDEKTKFNTIFVTFKTMGMTKERLLDTANKYVELINSQAAGFAGKIDSILKTDVADKQSKSAQIAKENEQIENQMIALTEKKNKNNEIINALNSEINEQVSSLNIKKASFESAASEFVGKIQVNIAKINQYL